jgi:hypothetical protein
MRWLAVFMAVCLWTSGVGGVSCAPGTCIVMLQDARVWLCMLINAPLRLQVLEEVMGSKPLYLRGGATIPALAAFQAKLGVETTMFAFSLPEDTVHAPNERWVRG